jgi:hypothetical protein
MGGTLADHEFSVLPDQGGYDFGYFHGVTHFRYGVDATIIPNLPPHVKGPAYSLLYASGFGPRESGRKAAQQSKPQ